MKILNLITVLLFLLVTGCTSLQTNQQIVRGDVENQLDKPRKFSNYREIFKYIADNESKSTVDPINDDKLLKLAADSQIDVCRVEGHLPPILVVTASYYNFFNNNMGVDDEIRSSTGNGRFYLFIPLQKNLTEDGNPNPGFELVGIGIGNSYSWTSMNHVPEFITTWHGSATQSPASIYQWDGKIFKLIKTELPNY